MIWFASAAAVLGWGLALALFVVLPGRLRRRDLQLTHALRSRVERLLRRRIEELGLDHGPPATSPADSPEDVIATITTLATQISDHERALEQVALEDTLNVEICDTQNLGRDKNKRHQ